MKTGRRSISKTRRPRRRSRRRYPVLRSTPRRMRRKRKGRAIENKENISSKETIGNEIIETIIHNSSDEYDIHESRLQESTLSDSDITDAYDKGYTAGWFDGGERKLGQLIPPRMIFPEITIDDVIRAGFKTLSARLVSLISSTEVYETLKKGLDSGSPLSVIRLGDGELLTLAHDVVIPTAQAQKWGHFLPYAGVELPDYASREALAEALKTADIIGVPESRHPSYQGLLFPVFRHYGLDYRKLRLTSSVINYVLNEEGFLVKLLQQRRLLLIGNEAPGLSVLLQEQGYHVVGVIHPVCGVGSVEQVMDQVAAIDFDFALVAAGIAAVMICTEIASKHGKVALDLGHLANKLVNGEACLLPSCEV